MAGYFELEEMTFRELADGERPNYLVDIARYLVLAGLRNEIYFGEWPALPPPASKEAVSSLPDIPIEEDGKNCSICLLVFQKGDKAKEMPCKHFFHANCILTWLEKTNSCPFCRHELPTDDEAYELFKEEKKRAEERKENIESLHNSMFS